MSVSEAPGKVGSFSFKIATSSEEVAAVLELRRNVWTVELGHSGGDEYDQRARHLIAKHDGTIVGACRIIGPNTGPLEIERYLDLGDYVAPDRMPAQVGGLFVIKSERVVTKGSLVALNLFRLGYLVALRAGATDVVMYTYQHLRRFYRGGLFDDPGRAFTHPTWGLVWFLHADLLRFRSQASDRRSAFTRLIDGPIPTNFELD